jgi:hypothetical protein
MPAKGWRTSSTACERRSAPRVSSAISFTGQPQRYRVDRISVQSMKASVWGEPPNSLMGGSGLSLASAHPPTIRRRIQAAI